LDVHHTRSYAREINCHLHEARCGQRRQVGLVAVWESDRYATRSVHLSSRRSVIDTVTSATASVERGAVSLVRISEEPLERKVAALV
jgi:hypothetical protein